MFFPTRVTAVIAIFEIQKDLGLLNVPAGLIFPVCHALPRLVSLCHARHVSDCAAEIFDAARIDGAGPVRMLLGIMLPHGQEWHRGRDHRQLRDCLGRISAGQDANTNQSAQTLPVVLSTATGGMGAWAWPRIAAVYIMAITPGVDRLRFAQRWYMKGLQEGALKA